MSGVEVISPGTQTTVQDWPGRTGLWEVGVPPSGPMDERSFRIGNRLLGNPEGAAGLEVTLTGPALRFDAGRRVAVTGAPLTVTLDGAPQAQWVAFDVPAGGVLRLGAIRGLGMRAYVLVGGGLDGEPTLGSRSVFAAAGLGGRPLRKGDRLALAPAPAPQNAPGSVADAPAPAPQDAPGSPADAPGSAAVAPGSPGSPPAGGALAGLGLRLHSTHTLRVVLGPHGAPDFLTPQGLAELLAASWRVHHHSDRTGIRLSGPRPAWARTDGGEAGLHPSNVLDSAYSVGTVMLAGEEAVIVGPDGPSLGGFVAIAQVIRADRWRLGQLRAGDEVVVRVVDQAQAERLHRRSESLIAGRASAAPVLREGRGRVPVDRPHDGAHGPIAYRRAGECAVLVELGEPRLDLRSRVRAHALAQALLAERIDGVGAVTAGVRSLHVQHRPERLGASALIDVLAALEAELPPPEREVIPGRIVRLPFSWRHSQAQRAVERYQASVRADAPWCPDNIDFIRRVNGLADERAVREIVLAASYLVLGLGDVYLGAPVAVPLDPRHRLVTSKYSPARTWTPANAVGIGGALLCVYGVEGPGGYQLVGRTVPIWHAGEEPPWRLRHFDRLRFEPVEEAELEELRAASDAGLWRPRTESAPFSLDEHERLLAAHAGEISAFTACREAAFAAERSAWRLADETAAVAA